MAAQAAAVLRDKRKRWENQFLHFIQFSAKHGWYLTHLFYVHNPNLAWQVREGSLKRRERKTPQFRSVKNKCQNVKIPPLSVTFSAPPNISICALFLYIFSILIDMYWSAAKACDLPDRRQFNGNCLQMKNLELPDCHSATPYIPQTSNGLPSISVQKYFTAISQYSTLLDIKLTFIALIRHP